MKPRMPKRIKIGAAEWRVVRLKRGSPQLLDEDGKDCLGICDYDSCTIYVLAGLRRPRAQEVLEHEKNHACTYPSLNGRTLGDEDFVEGISPMTLQVLRDNPELVEYLRS